MKIPTMLAAVLLVSGMALAQVPAEPILLTSCGQSADVLMVKSLLTRDSMSFRYLPNATAADVAGTGSVMLVLGGSSKGLGAAKISAEDEIARVEGLLEAAKTASVPVVALHLGGLTRRGALSDPFNQLGADGASQLIVVKGGNDDGFFTTIAAAKQIPLETAKSAFDLGPVLKAMYRPTE